jgi:hypothetical protein
VRWSAARYVVLWLGVASYFVASVAWLALTSRDLDLPPGSSLEIGPQGTSLARAYLAARRENVRILTREVSSSELELDAVVFRLRPALVTSLRPEPEGPAATEVGWLTREEDAWVRAGGRLVLAIASPYRALRVEAADGRAVSKVAPVWSGVARLELASARALLGWPAEAAQPVFAAGPRPVLARHRLGRGDVVLCAVPEVFENALLGRADHLRLLEALAGTRRTVYFDERSHGIVGEAGLLELLGRFGMGPAVVLSGLAGVAAFWRRRVRLGPPVPERAAPGSEAANLVEALGDLYDRALDESEALALYQRALARAVSARTGLRGQALDARLNDVIGGGSTTTAKPARGPRAAGFDGQLRRLNDAFRRLHAHTR